MLKDYFSMFRPFTLVAVIIGSIAGGLIAIKDTGINQYTIIKLAVIVFIMAVSNASGNVINEVFDIDIDRINKPYRSIVSGKVSRDNAISLSVMLFGLAIVMAFIINLYFGIVVSIIEFFAWNYSAPPIRFKKRFIWSNLSIATPRGALGLFAVYLGLGGHPYSIDVLIASIGMGAYVFMGNITKDFPDYEGDKANGIRNFVTVYGIEKSAKISIPFYYIPFVLITLGAILKAIPLNEIWVDAILPISIYQSYLLYTNPLKKGWTENSITWTLFYLEMGLILILYALIYYFS